MARPRPWPTCCNVSGCGEGHVRRADRCGEERASRASAGPANGRRRSFGSFTKRPSDETKADRGGVAARRDQRRVGAREVHSPRASVDAAPVVGTPAAGCRAGGDLRADGRRPVGVRRRAAFGRGNEARRPAGAEEAVGSSRIGRGRAASDRKREHQGKGEAGRYNGRSRPSCCKTGQGAATSACSDEQRSSGNGGRTGAERPLPQPERDPAHGHGRDRPLGSGHRSREGSVSVSMEVIVSPGRTCCRRFNHRH